MPTSRLTCHWSPAGHLFARLARWQILDVKITLHQKDPYWRCSHCGTGQLTCHWWWGAAGGQASSWTADTNQLTIGQWPTNWPLSCRRGLIFTCKFPILVINPWVNSVSLKPWWMTKLTSHGSDTDVYVPQLLEKEASVRQELLRALSFTLMKRICNASLCRLQKPSS